MLSAYISFNENNNSFVDFFFRNFRYSQLSFKILKDVTRYRVVKFNVINCYVVTPFDHSQLNIKFKKS